MIIYRFKIICTVRHALRTVNIKALLLHALRRTVVIKYMSLGICHGCRKFISLYCESHMVQIISKLNYKCN